MSSQLYGTNYSIWLSTPTGQRILNITRYLSLEYTLSVNSIGVLKLTLPNSFPISYVQEDSRIDVYRQVPGGARYRDGEVSWLIRDWDFDLDQNGGESITILAYSCNEILDRAIIAYAAGTAYANKTSTAVDNIIKALVRENLGSLATDTTRSRATWLVIDANTTLGPTSTKSMPWRQLLPTLRELAQDADNLGTPVFFDVIRPTGGSTFRFLTQINQLGIDHSTTPKITLSTKNGTLANVTRSYNSIDERNIIYVGGQGQGSDRRVVNASDSARMSKSPINRRESFVDGRNTIYAALTSEANTALKNARVRETFTAKIRDTQAIRFGREYGYGDRVIANFGARSAACRLDAVTVSVSRGKETIDGELRVDE